MVAATRRNILMNRTDSTELLDKFIFGLEINPRNR
jgi:hypothetical protein